MASDQERPSASAHGPASRGKSSAPRVVFAGLALLSAACGLKVDGRAPPAAAAEVATQRQAVGTAPSSLQACTADATCAMPLVAAGSNHALALESDGTVWAWGLNGGCQIGDGTTTTPVASEVQVGGGLSGVVELAAGARFSVALRGDGTVWTWGNNDNGQLGDGTTTQRCLPVQVPTLTSVVAIAAGEQHVAALKSDGTVWTWGDNTRGQLGDGSTTERHGPVSVTTLTNVVAVAAGREFTVAVKSDGTVWSWGANGSGQLGDGTTTLRKAPVQVANLTGVVAVGANNRHSLAVKSDGSVWAWGYNGDGQLGNGNQTTQHQPVATSVTSGAVAVAAGYLHSVAVKSDGTVWTWGSNANGELGFNTAGVSQSTPTQVTGVSGVAVAAGNRFTLALGANGSLWAWGTNDYHQLGDDSTTGASPHTNGHRLMTNDGCLRVPGCVSGACVGPVVPAGAVCDDGDFLTKDDVCNAGVCRGTPDATAQPLVALCPEGAVPLSADCWHFANMSALTAWLGTHSPPGPASSPVTLYLKDGAMDVHLYWDGLSGGRAWTIQGGWDGTSSTTPAGLTSFGPVGLVLRNWSGAVTIEDVTLGPGVLGAGGAFYVSTTGDITLHNVHTADTTAPLGFGTVRLYTPGNVTITDSSFERALVAGAMWIEAAGDVRLTNVRASDNGNGNDYAMGLVLYHVKPRSLTVTDCTMSGNYSGGLVGDAIGPITVSGLTVTGTRGGTPQGVVNLNGGSLQMSSITVTGNAGPGLLVGASGPVELDGVTANNNGGTGLTVTNAGGGFARNVVANGNGGNGATLSGIRSLSNCTFGDSAATANVGYGLSASGDVSVTDLVASFNLGAGASFTGGTVKLSPSGRGLLFTDNGGTGLTLNGKLVEAEGLFVVRNRAGLEAGYQSVAISNSTILGGLNVAVGDAGAFRSLRLTDVSASGGSRVSNAAPTGEIALTRCTFDDSSNGVGLTISSNVSVSLDQVSASRNHSFGIFFNSVIAINYPANVTMSGCRFDSNGDDGVRVRALTGALTTCGSSASNNGGWGINGNVQATFANGLTLTGNTLGANNLTSGGTCPGPTACQRCEALAAVNGVCPWVTLQDGDACNDGDACTSTDVCAAGICSGTSYSCAPPDACHETGSCNGDGTCTYANQPNGTVCDDATACTSTDHCFDGACIGTSYTCGPAALCHEAGVCNGDGTCTFPNLLDGTPCDDGDACTWSDACLFGDCLGTSYFCPSPGQCEEAGSCKGDGTCAYSSKTDGTGCDDGNPSTVDDACAGGVCAGIDHCAGVVCTALDECHEVGACVDHATGACSNPAKADGAACTNGVCRSGLCTPGEDAGGPLDASQPSESDASEPSQPDAEGPFSADASGPNRPDAGGVSVPDGALSAGVDAGSPATAPGGCGCSSGGAPMASWAVMMLGLQLLAVRRRR